MIVNDFWLVSCFTDYRNSMHIHTKNQHSNCINRFKFFAFFPFRRSVITKLKTGNLERTFWNDGKKREVLSWHKIMFNEVMKNNSKHDWNMFCVAFFLSVIIFYMKAQLFKLFAAVLSHKRRTLTKRIVGEYFVCMTAKKISQNNKCVQSST